MSNQRVLQLSISRENKRGGLYTVRLQVQHEGEQERRWLKLNALAAVYTKNLLQGGCMLIRVNFDPIQEIGPKVGIGCSFTRLQ